MKKKLVIGGLALALIVAAACGWRAYSDSQAAPDDGGPAPEAGAEGDEGPGGGDAAQSDRQRDLEERYGEAEREVVALLSANVWADESGTGTLTFSGSGFTEAKEGYGEETRTFAVSALKQERIEGAAAGEYTDRYTLSADVDGSDVIMTLERPHPASGAEQPWRISSDGFALASSYLRVEAAGELEVVGVEGDVVGLLGGEENVAAMEGMLRDVAAQSYPTASSATWDGKASVDYSQGTVTLSFSLDNQARTKLGVLHPLGSDAFELTTKP